VKRRSARDTDTRGADTDTGQQVLAQEAARLRELLRDARAATAAEALGQARQELRILAAIVAGVALLIGGLIGHFGFPAAQSTPDEMEQPAIQPPSEGITDADRVSGDLVEAAPWPLRVYISGAVAKAQVVEVPAGSIVSDVLELAGGATADADLDAVNLATPVSDNQHIVIPRLAERVEDTGDEIAGVATPIALIDINTASCDELATLPRIGETRAADIVSYRAVNGPFERIEDIQDVPGIGPVTFEQISLLITIED